MPRVRDVTLLEDREIWVGWTINDNFIESWVKDGAKQDATKILKTIAESEIDYPRVWLSGTFSMQDVYGNVSETMVVSLWFDRATVDRINWSGITYHDIYLIADDAGIHPSFQDMEQADIPATGMPVPTPKQENGSLVEEGTYLVGADVEPDIYVGQAGEGLFESCYWARLSNLTGSDDILANGNAEGLYYVEVLSDDRALETACELLPIELVPARDEFLTVLPPGTYLMGRDIEAGTYRGKAGDDILASCYWARLSNVSGSDDILANDNATGQYFIEVLSSDFALNTDCEIEKVE